MGSITSFFIYSHQSIADKVRLDVHMYLFTYAICCIMFAEVKSMPTTNATELRKELFETIGNVIGYNEPVTVNTKKGNAVIISESDYNAMMETIYIMSQPKLVKNIKDGEKEDPKKMKAYDPAEKW